MHHDIETLRKKYTKGKVLELIHMDDIQAPPVGTKCVVNYVDDAGGIHVTWDTGGGLALLPGIDRFKIVEPS
jgi:hypothetical protein